MGLWTRKDLAAATAGDDSIGAGRGQAEGAPRLRRALGPVHLILIGVGSTIGAGIFVITGTAAAQYAGPAIAISFIVAGLACLCTAFCYAELAALIPVSGSAYTYAYATLGELAAWVIGWCLILEYLFAAATVAVGWSSYFTEGVAALGLVIPPGVSSAPLTFDGLRHPILTGAVFNLPAAAIVVAMSVVLFLGIRESALANSLLVLVKLAVILLVIICGVFYIDPDNWRPFIPPNRGEAGQYGWSGIMRASGVIFFAYIGFDAISTSAQEARNPGRDLGIGILAALAICTVLYVAMGLVLTGLVPYRLLNVADPIYVAIAAAGPGLAWLRPVVSVGAIVGLASTILVTLYGQTRIFYTMAEDGLLPPLFARLRSRQRTPVWGTAVVGLAAALIAGLFPIEILGELVSIGTLLAFMIVCLGVLILRWRAPALARPFRAPFSPLMPLLGMASCGYLMFSLPADTWVRLVVWLGLGLVVYGLYGARRSLVAQVKAPSGRSD